MSVILILLIMLIRNMTVYVISKHYSWNDKYPIYSDAKKEWIDVHRLTVFIKVYTFIYYRVAMAIDLFTPYRHIPEDPTGDLNGFEYMQAESHDIKETRFRMRGIYIMFVMTCFVSWTFTRNARMALSVLRHNHLNVASWLIVIQAVCGMVFGFVYGHGYILPWGPSCRQSIDYTIAGMAVSNICENLTLLLKAYVVHQRNKRMLIYGCLLIVPSPVIIMYVILVKSPTIITHEGGCLVRYPFFLGWTKLGLDSVVNAFFSAAFLKVVQQQYRDYGAKCWRILARDGIGVMCSVIASNVISALIAALNFLGDLSDFVWVTNWIITSTLLAQHVFITHCRLAEFTQPKKSTNDTSNSVSASVTVHNSSSKQKAPTSMPKTLHFASTIDNAYDNVDITSVPAPENNLLSDTIIPIEEHPSNPSESE
ncbi:hypothetical protein BDF22DRAFT_469738 [Syncephalis plumigaleata]|nr:hypothetical protein BDF22DRAFT_469738 [Syncephalis plumigaleata]